MIVTFLNIVIAGLLLGGIYALIAVGLSLQYGVARVLNISHGEFIMLGAFATWMLYTLFGVNPLVSLVISGPIVLLIGFFLHKMLFRSLLNSSASLDIFEGKSMLAQFLSPHTNRRTDEWGRNPENRMRIVIEVYEKIRDVVGKNLQTMERILEEGKADLISLCRALIREPDLSKEMAEGRKNPAKCAFCNRCLGELAISACFLTAFSRMRL